MKQLLTIQLMILAVFVLLGNGIRSIGSSTVSMSQGEFASFLNISVERTAVLVEASMGGALLALALAPFLISYSKAGRIIGRATVLAVICYGSIGAIMHYNPSLLMREVTIIAAFAFGGFAVAFFAPFAQLAIAEVESERGRSALTTVWTAAMPITMLATPMLVKYVAFDIGIGNFFFILAALPVVFFLFVPLAFPPKTLESTSADSRVSLKLMGPVILMLILFQASTMSVSLAGITHPVTLLLLAVMVGVGAVLFLRRRPTVVDTKLPSHVAMMMALLFLLQIASTGLYDAAYLIRHLCSSSFIADRATLGAMAQIAGVFGAGALLLRWPQVSYPLLWTSLALVLAGTLMMMLYPYRPADVTLFLSSKAVLSAGVGIGSAVLVRSILAAAGENRVIIMAPAFLILIGTEVGIELLEIVFELTENFNGDVNAAYENAFRFQTLAPLTAMAVLLIGGTRSWRHLHPANASY